MTPQKWYEGIPPAEAVLANETQHPRPDGIRLGDITVSYRDKPGGVIKKTDDLSYGEWVSFHYKSRLQSYVSISRLKVVDGEVLVASGFCMWMPLSEIFNANDTRYFPVGQDGLPVFYESTLKF